ncbi:Kdo hydroxylase family protein [Rhodoferax sediminis]|uniref:3-deoxy-D-manno-oct-2-ulosonic acid (Kdo) hydroxylase n=1 Tax=Rhodoferax sediminis TaxID=2509614 RepID=A0A515DAL2_9BURK|nr:Kdo hydroxylase family protein [Rhodoferax sediminis]QDL37452.1 3-deoxy-D-manno-oct-2-ulosonic acid (Kdo) hydroxylase [Rhodoferax sediminis]
MESQIVEIEATAWQAVQANAAWTAALEAGKVLYFPRLGFELLPQEAGLLNPGVLSPKSRNISLDAKGALRGANGEPATVQALAAMIGRFRAQSQQLIAALLPHYTGFLRLAPTSYRPMQVESRQQSWRADDRRLHVDAFPSRPNDGERILRVFTNVNPSGLPRVWRVGEPFETVARRFLPRARAYSPWQARALRALHVTKSLRSEYDHLMLQLHDGMKSDLDYQQTADQATVPFPAGSVWVCFSDQTSHAVMSGQYMLEQTLFLAPEHQYDPQASPLAILSRLTGRPLVTQRTA